MVEVRKGRMVIVVGADPSSPARIALTWAAEAARAFKGEVVVAHARGIVESGTAGDELPDWLLDLVDAVDPDVPVRVCADDGPAADVLLRVADREGAGLVVVGRRGSGSPLEMTLGSTSREVTSRASVPVVVVPT